MSDYELSVPTLGASLGSRPSLSLGDFNLELSPETRALLAGTDGATVTPEFRRIWFNPDWNVLDRSMTSFTVPGTNQCSWSAPGAGPSTPRAGTPSDVMKAVYKLPCIRRYLDARLAEIERVGVRVWENAPLSGKVGIAAGGVLVVGSGILLGPLSGVDIPIPGLSGLTATVSLGDDAVPSSHSHLPSSDAWSFRIGYSGEF